MSSATLYREGTDLDDLLADLDQQYPGQVRVVEIARPREGGVLGFFAKQRVGVHYQLLSRRSAAPTGGGPSAVDGGRYDDPLGNAYSLGDDGPAEPESAADADLFSPSTETASGAQFAEVLAELAVRSTSRAAEVAAGSDYPLSPVARRYGRTKARRKDGLLPGATGQGDGHDAADTDPGADTEQEPVGGAGPIVRSTQVAGAGPISEQPDPAAPVADRLARAYAIIQAHAESTASEIASELAADPTSGFVPAPPPRAVPSPHPTTEADSAPAHRRRPRAVPRFQPLGEAAVTAKQEPAPHASAADAHLPAAAPRAAQLNWSFPTTAGAAGAITAGATVSARAPLDADRMADSTGTAPGTQAPIPIAPAAEWTTPQQLRHQLAALGVAEHRIPRDARHAFAAIDELTHALPVASPPPTGRGSVLVLAGRAREAALSAESLLTAAGGAITEVWSYGCPTGSGAGRAVTADHVITSVAEASDVIAQLRKSAAGSVLVIVGTDGSSWTNRPGEIIEALQADEVWAVVEATAKPADAASALGRLGPVSAIAVAGAEHSSSPATVWDLDLPIALLDGRPATAQAWSALLMGKLIDREQTCSGARC